MISTDRELIQRANQLILDERAEDAVKELQTAIGKAHRPRLNVKLAQVYHVLGETVRAKQLLKDNVLNIERPHLLDVADAEIGYVKPIIIDQFKLIYYNAPKCGSTTIKYALRKATRVTSSIETGIHADMNREARVISGAYLDADYADYKSLAVTRAPRSRLRSYWSMNVQQRGSLLRGAQEKETFYGLSTSPSYTTFLKKFKRYREVFRDVRLHTNPLDMYLGAVPARITMLVDIANISQVLDEIRRATNTSFGDPQKLRSSNKFDQDTPENVDMEEELLRSYYSKEISLYGR